MFTAKCNTTKAVVSCIIEGQLPRQMALALTLSLHPDLSTINFGGRSHGN